MMIKHIRNPKGNYLQKTNFLVIFLFVIFLVQGPNDLYKKPVTCSQDIGIWTKSDPIKENLKWANIEKRVFPKSEMTA
jgi:hypothetical protein